MIAQKRPMDFKMIHKLPRMTRVFRSDEISLPKHAQGTGVISSKFPMGVAQRYKVPTDSAMDTLLSFIISKGILAQTAVLLVHDKGWQNRKPSPAPF